MKNEEKSDEKPGTPSNKPFSEKTYKVAKVVIVCILIIGVLLVIVPAEFKEKIEEMKVETRENISVASGSRDKIPPLTSKGCAPTPIPSKTKKVFATKVALLGVDRKTEWNKDVPPRTDYFFWGPEETKVEFEDGTVWSINGCFGVRRPVVRFWGPAGKIVTIEAYKY